MKQKFNEPLVHVPREGMGDIDCSKEPSLTRQSFTDECDINRIMERFEKTGVLPQFLGNEPSYLDVSNVVDYHEALNIVNEANSLFYGLNAFLRSRFDNDPAKLVAFISDSANYEEAVKLGLVKARPPATPPAVAAPLAPPGSGPA
ncbi:MAG: internal scaffolding protein [Microviridae sp.]|nr:MAG: internal scaffolding protein [Microviridae sp.]